MKKKGGLAGFIIILIFLLVVASVVVIVSLSLSKRGHGDEFKAERVDLLLRSLSDGNPISASYFFSGFNVSKAGVIPKESFEQVLGVWNNESYDLTAWADGYYRGVSSCSGGIGRCFVYLDKAGVVSYKIIRSDGKFFVQFNVSDGVVHNALVCEGHSLDVIRVNPFTLDDKAIGKVGVPQRLSSKYDTCWGLGGIVDRADFYVKIDSYNLDDDDFVNFILVDECSIEGGDSGFFDCGIPDYEFNLW